MFLEDQKSYKKYDLLTVKIKDYSAMINGRNFFQANNKNSLGIYDKIRKIAAGQGDYYTTRCLLDYPNYKEYFKLIPIDLIKQQKLDADPKAIEQINFTANLNTIEGKTMFFITKKAKKKNSDFSKGAVKVLWFYFVLI